MMIISRLYTAGTSEDSFECSKVESIQRRASKIAPPEPTTTVVSGKQRKRRRKRKGKRLLASDGSHSGTGLSQDWPDNPVAKMEEQSSRSSAVPVKASKASVYNAGPLLAVF